MASSILKKATKLTSTSKDKYLAQKPSSLRLKSPASKARLTHLTPKTTDPSDEAGPTKREILDSLTGREPPKRAAPRPMVGSTVRKNPQAKEEELPSVAAGSAAEEQ